MNGKGGAIDQILLTGKTVDTDLVLYFPNNSIANTEIVDKSYYKEDMKFDRNEKICTDIDLNVGVKRIFTAGECASPLNFANSERYKTCSYADSIVQGMVAGFNISAMGIPLAVVPYREYDFYGHKFRETGSMNYFEEVVTEGDFNSFDYMAYYMNKGIGVMKVAGFPKQAKDMQVLRECIRTGVAIGGDPEVPVLFKSVNIPRLEKLIRVVTPY